VDTIREQVNGILRDTLQELSEKGTLTVPEEITFSIDAPRNPEHGDFATNVALVLAKPAKKNPREIAAMISDNWVDPQGLIANHEIAGPGFINLRISDQRIQETIGAVLQHGAKFGTNVNPTGKRVQVEFVSANPTGPLHLGHARGAFMGDAVARLLQAAGHHVEREFYVNDAGKQIETLGESIYARYRELYGEEIHLEPGQYPASYVTDIAKTLRDEVGDSLLGKDPEHWLDTCIEVGIRENLRTIKETLALANIEMDHWFSEKDLHNAGDVIKIVEDYRERGCTYEAARARGSEDRKRRGESKAAEYKDQQKGGTFLQTTQLGDEEDRIILRGDGTPVYLTADLAYHKNKFERGFHRMIDVWGADHAGHVSRIRAGMGLAGCDESQLDFLLVQIVRLTRGGDEVKISKRTGDVYELSDLINEVGADAVRFIFLMRAATSQFDFDLDLAVKQSNDNPVFYCQMGHARSVNVMGKAEEKGVGFQGADSLSTSDLALLALPEERDMLKKIDGFPEVVGGAAEALEPHRVLYYAQSLIADFHSYFSKYKTSHRIISDDERLTQARLGMVAALRQTLKNALTLLGIDAPDWMEPPKEEHSDSVQSED
jgi:arginyl-tRNA synthetase